MSISKVLSTTLAFCLASAIPGQVFAQAPGQTPVLPPPAEPATRPSSAEVAAATQRLSSRIPEDRQAAADALRRMGVSAAAARPALLSAVNDESLVVQVAAAEAWAATFDRKPEAVAGLLSGLKDERELVRIAAAGRLWVVGEKDAKQIVPALIPLLGDSKPAVRAKVAGSIGLLADAAPDEAAKAVEPLIRLLADPDKDAWEQRFDAARALLRIGPAAKRALPAISAAMVSKESIPFLRERLIPLLPKIAGRSELQPLLTTLMKDSDREVADAATIVLATLSASPSSATKPQ